MAEARVERRLAAIVAADVAGYSQLMHREEEATHAKLTALLMEAVHPAIAEYGGRIVKNTGDGFLAEFPSAVGALRAAMQFQARVHELTIDEAEDGRIAFRVGINIGDVIVEPHDIFGDGVNIAARLESIAEPGSICISSSAYEQVRGKVAVEFSDLGEQRLKNIDRPVRIYAAKSGGSLAMVAPNMLHPEAQKPLSLPDKPSITVLPFQNMSGDPDQVYFAEGMVEEINTALSKRGLCAIVRNSRLRFNDKPVDIKRVARDLGVRYVLEGSVRKSGNHIRIACQLIDAASGAHLWADRFDGALEDVIELQDQVASSVVGAIAPSVIRAEMERAERKPASSRDAYDYYLRGMSANWQFTRDSADQAIVFYEQAIELDPQFAPAHSGLAVALNLRRAWGWSTDPAADSSRAIAYAKSALRLESQNPSVLSSSGLVLLFCGGEVELADGILEEAIRLDPNCMPAWLWGGWAKISLGEHRTAIDCLQRAMRLSPLDTGIFFAHGGLAFAHFFLGNYEEGHKNAAAATRHHPNYVGGLRAAMVCNALCGNIYAAQELWRQVALLSPSDRVSETRKWLPLSDKDDLAKIQEAYRLAGMPE